MKHSGLKLKLVLLVVLTHFSMTTFSQSEKIDSLKSLLSISKGTDRIDILFELSRSYNEDHINDSFRYAREAFLNARAIGDTLRIIRASRLYAQILRRLNKIDSSIALFNHVLPIAKRHNYLSETKAILNAIATAYMNKGNYDKALRYHFESLNLRKQQGDKDDISLALYNLGLVYYKLKDYEKALSFYLQVLNVREGTKKNYMPEILLIDISLCYAYMGDLLNAQKFIDRAFVLCRDGCSDHFSMNAKFSQGVVFSSQQNKDSEAEKTFFESYRLAAKIGNERFQLDNLVYLIQISLSLKNVVLSENYLRIAEELLERGSPYNLEKIKLYNQISSLYKKSHDYKKAMLYQSKYISLKDSVYNEELINNLMKVEAEYLERENRTRIESQNKILALNEEVMYRQKIGNASFGAIAFLVIIISVILAKNNKHKQLINKHLDERVTERTRELEMNRDALHRAWQERDALISKASSEIQSSIATLKGLCSLGAREIDHPKATEYWKQLDNTSNGLSAIMNKMHHSYKINTPSE